MDLKLNAKNGEGRFGAKRDVKRRHDGVQNVASFEVPTGTVPGTVFFKKKIQQQARRAMHYTYKLQPLVY